MDVRLTQDTDDATLAAILKYCFFYIEGQIVTYIVSDRVYNVNFWMLIFYNCPSDICRRSRDLVKLRSSQKML